MEPIEPIRRTQPEVRHKIMTPVSRSWHSERDADVIAQVFNERNKCQVPSRFSATIGSKQLLQMTCILGMTSEQAKQTSMRGGGRKMREEKKQLHLISDFIFSNIRHLTRTPNSS